MIEPVVKLPSRARVLEVGSGHNPHPRSDVLCDLYLDDRERAGPLVADRAFVQADGEFLPFVAGSFDFVIAKHVAEHTRDIERFFGELTRVASAGYLETPSAVGEHLFGWRKHRWMLTLHDGVVHVRRKRAHTPFGRVFHELMRKDPQMTAIYYRYPDLFRVRLHWSERIPYRMLEDDETVPDLDAEAVVDELLAQRSRPTYWLRAYLSRAVREPLHRMRSSLGARARGRS